MVKATWMWGRAATALALSAVALGGCSTTEPFGPKPVTIPTNNAISGASTDLRNAVNGAGGPSSYASAGYRLAYRSCSEYFDNITMMQNGVGFSSDSVGAFAAAGATVAVLQKNATRAAQTVARLAASALLADSILKSYDKKALLTPYPAETKGLILSAMKAYENGAAPSSAATADDAVAMVQEYANFCTYSSIPMYAKQVLNSATPHDSNTPSESILTVSDGTHAAAIAASIGVPATRLTDRQLAVLYFYLVKPADAFNQKDPAKRLIGQLPAKSQALFIDGDAPKSPANVADAAKLKASLSAIYDANDDFKGLVGEVKKDFDADVAKNTPKASATTTPSTTSDSGIQVPFFPPVAAGAELGVAAAPRPRSRPNITFDRR